MKNAVVLATAVVAAVILIQGAGTSPTVLPTRAAADIVASSPAATGSASELSSLVGLKPASTSAASAKTTASTSTTTSTSTAAAPAAATDTTRTASATSASAVVVGRTFTSTPAPVISAPAPPPPAPPAPTCPTAIGGSTAGAPGASDAAGIPGTTSADIAGFAAQYNALRVAACLQPVPYANIRYSTCLQQRLWWMADDPSTNSASAWGHTSTAVRSDGLPIVGCDGDLAGGSGYTGASLANAWWASADHKASLFQPAYSGSMARVCIAFAMTHGGVNVPGPNEAASFVRAAAYWYGC